MPGDTLLVLNNADTLRIPDSAVVYTAKPVYAHPSDSIDGTNLEWLIVPFLLLLLVSVAVSLPATIGQEKQDSGSLPEGAMFLPEGEARAIILSACVQCHNLRNTVAQRKTADRWRRTVNEMIWRGTSLTVDEAETIIKYLAVSLGSNKTMPAVVKKESEKR